MRESENARQNEKAPRPERHGLEDVDDVVDRGVIRVLLVAVVQPVDAEEQKPQRQARREEPDLPPPGDLVWEDLGRREHECDDVGAEKPHDVGGSQEPPHQPATLTPDRMVDYVQLGRKVAVRNGDRVLPQNGHPIPPDTKPAAVRPRAFPFP